MEVCAAERKKGEKLDIMMGYGLSSMLEVVQALMGHDFAHSSSVSKDMVLVQVEPDCS
jgi:hypothetical protein